jgi:hypothetical protein
MFNRSKYTTWYWSIIKRAQAESRAKGSIYFESHHVIPKSLGGKFGRENQVLLTAREHFICHMLLCRMTARDSIERAKMLHAFMLMKGSKSGQQRYINAAIYSKIKIEYAAHRSGVRRGQKLSEDHKRKIAASRVGKSIVTDAGRLRISELAKSRQRKPFSEEARRNISAGMLAARAKRKSMGREPGLS